MSGISPDEIFALSLSFDKGLLFYHVCPVDVCVCVRVVFLCLGLCVCALGLCTPEPRVYEVSCTHCYGIWASTCPLPLISMLLPQ